MKLLLGIVRIVTALGTFGLAALALLALLGFAVPEFDLINHFQVLVFFGALLAVIVAILVFQGSRWKSWVTGAALAGL
ncbi:MAG: hypothetical protein KKF33_03245, partial [Alphaproteobacteria bacterium]|nr:hypothetical protein [Alphaproteobacteria bacterium]